MFELNDLTGHYKSTTLCPSQQATENLAMSRYKCFGLIAFLSPTPATEDGFPRTVVAGKKRVAIITRLASAPCT